MSVLRQYHEALGELVFRFEGTLERFTGDGLMVFFNDPLPCSDAGHSLGSDGGRNAKRCRGAHRASGIAAGTISGSPSGSRRATQHLDGSGSRAGSTTPRSERSRTWRLASATSRELGRSLSASACTLASRISSLSNELTDLQLKGFSRPVTAYEIVGLNAVEHEKAGA